MSFTLDHGEELSLLLQQLAHGWLRRLQDLIFLKVSSTRFSSFVLITILWRGPGGAFSNTAERFKTHFAEGSQTRCRG